MYTRRQFLQLAGIAVVTSQIPHSTRLIESLIQDTSTLQGRALTAQTVFAQPSLAAAQVSQLWPDSVTPILAVHDNWYHLPQGFVPRTSLQPLTPYRPIPQPEHFTAPFWAEVIGPVASVRQHCAANAPLVTRIGHGGVARVVDFLPGEPSPWYGLAADEGELLGWTPAIQWQRVDEAAQTTGSVRLELDTRRQQLTAWEDDRMILHAACSIGHDLQPGTYTVREQQIGGMRLCLEDGCEVHGVPWRVVFDDYDLSGAYWHNDFGTPVAGTSVQVTPVLARWLYASLSQHAGSITVV